MTGTPLRLAVLHGGPSREHEVSNRSGEAVTRALRERGHHVLPVRIEPDGRWCLEGPNHPRIPQAVSDAASTTTGRIASAALTLAAIGDQEASERVDAVFVALHGHYGEDGTVQGFLEAAGMPYTGAGVAASALAMDKERTKEVLSFHGLRSPPWVAIDRVTWAATSGATVARVTSELGFPVIVKPPREGSSFGVSVARDEEELRRDVETCLETPDGRALVEQRIDGVELTCPVLGNSGGPLRTLPLVEIVPDDRELFDYAAKYEGESQEICPARVSGEIGERVRAAAMTAHRILGCDGISRSDFIVDREDTIWFLETNTVPGLTEESLVPLSAGEAGIAFPELCEIMVKLALDRAAR